MGINKYTRPTPSSPVSNPHLILHKSDSLQVTPTNSSQVRQSTQTLSIIMQFSSLPNNYDMSWVIPFKVSPIHQKNY